MTNKLYWLIGISISVIILFLFVRAITPQAGASDKENICHKTSSQSHPWEAVNVNIGSHSNHLEDFPYNGPLKDNGKPTNDGDEWCEENVPHNGITPTPTPTPSPTPPQEVCQQESWTCGECSDPISDSEHVCYTPFNNFCTEHYDCSFQEVCEGEICERQLVCDCNGGSTPEQPQVVSQPVGPAGPPAVPQCVEQLKPALVQGAERVDSDTVVFHWHPSTDNPSKQSFRYGYAQDNLPYSVLDFPGDVSEITINDVADKVHVFGQVISYKEGCISYSNSFDP